MYIKPDTDIPRSMSKGAFGIGDVCLEPLREVWGRSLLRINNSMDNTVTPFPSRIGIILHVFILISSRYLKKLAQ